MHKFSFKECRALSATKASAKRSLGQKACDFAYACLLYATTRPLLGKKGAAVHRFAGETTQRIFRALSWGKVACTVAYFRVLTLYYRPLGFFWR